MHAPFQQLKKKDSRIKFHAEGPFCGNGVFIFAEGH